MKMTRKSLRNTTSNRFSSSHVSSGFTLLEMVIVLGIIAMIMGGAIFVMKGISDSGALTVVRGDFKSIENALQMYRTNARMYPSQEQGLEALTKRPTTSPKPKSWSKIMDEVPKDPWNKPYIYKFPGSIDPSRPEIITYGKDGIEGTEDDMSSQKN